MKTLKINLVAVIALFIAAGTMSFKTVDSLVNKKQSLHWYIKVDNEWVPDQNGPDPSIECQGGTQLCAKGFQSPPTEPVDDNTSSAETRHRN